MIGQIKAERLFLSTSPLRGTTFLQTLIELHINISIHVPLAGDDAQRRYREIKRKKFLSTSPLRGTTGARIYFAAPKLISIHVPLAGDDPRPAQTPTGS